MKPSLYRPESIRELTAQAREARAELVSAQGSPKDEAIKSAFYAGEWGCQRESVRRLISAITGIDVPSVNPSIQTFIAGAIYQVFDHSVLVVNFDDDGDAHFVTNEGKEHVYVISSRETIRFLDPKRHTAIPASESEVESWLVAAGLIDAPTTV